MRGRSATVHRRLRVPDVARRLPAGLGRRDGAKVETPDDIRAIAARVSRLAQDMTRTRITPDADGLIHIPAAPGLGVEVNTDALETYHVEVGIRVSGQTVFQPPSP